MEEIKNVTITIPAKFTFKNQKLNEISINIAQIGQSMASSNREVSKLLGEVKKDKLYEEDGFKSVAEYAETTFGIAKSLAYQLAKVGERFYLVESEAAKKAAAMLPPSNLAEIANMTDEQIEKAIDAGEISPASTQKKLRDVAAGVKHFKPKVLEDYDIEVYIYHADGVETLNYNSHPLETVRDDALAHLKCPASKVIEKPFVREGKYDGEYHRGIKVILCPTGELVKIVYGIVNKPKPEKKPGKKTLDELTDEEIMEMLAARKAAREAEAAKK